MNIPKVSVLMPVYNTRAEYLRAAVKSILVQTYNDFEFLIIDDGSSNEVEKVIRSYSDPRIIFSRNEVNLGIASTRNKLLEMARGEYLAVMDSDDLSMPDRFQKQVDFLDMHSEVGLVGSQVRVIPNNKIREYPQDNDIIEDMLVCGGNYFWHPALMIRKSVLTSNQIYYDPAFVTCEDYDLFCKLIGKTKFANLPEILFHYRWNKQNTTYTKQYQTMVYADRVKKKAKRDYPEIWARAKNKKIISYYYKLFGTIPIMTRRNQGRKSEYLLFGFLPVLTRRYRGSTVWND